MRRPLNWIVVSISLLVLFANRMVAGPAPQVISAVETAAPGLFAYVQEDGTQVYLPTPKSAVLAPSIESVKDLSGFDQWMNFEAAPPLSADPTAALYTWATAVSSASR